MRHIPKGSEPPALAGYRPTPGASYDDKGFPHDDVRNSIVRDQKGLCCFCMRRIRATQTGMKVAHYIPRTVNRELETDWNNLLGACAGLVDKEDRSPANQTCDTRQGSSTLSLDPRKPAITSQIQYASGSGKIVISNKDRVLQDDVEQVLNLNHPLLCKARMIALTVTLGELSKQKREGDWSAAWLARWLKGRSAGAELPEYFGIIEHWVGRRIARAERAA